jgi:hypothetical protein
MRAWEPYATLRIPVRYEHVLEATGEVGSVTIARFVVASGADGNGPPLPSGTEASAWIAIAQDVRIKARAAATNDLAAIFGETLDTVALPRRPTLDPAFDHVFAAFAATDADLAAALTPRARRLLLSWRTPVHLDVRPGGFVLAPVALQADPASLSWLLKALHAFGEKAGAGRP